MSDTPFLGCIFMFAGNFAPRGYALCQGQILPIAQNTALFSLLGTTYGGNGQTTFALPDLRGRAPIGQGQGPGLSPITLGEVAGTETTTLLITNMPAHNHTLTCDTNPASVGAPSGNLLADSGTSQSGGVPIYSNSNAPNGSLNPQSIGVAGGSQPFAIRNPYLGINYIIALQGIFPSRN
jgi:microcystin-dependent protein